MCARGVDDLEPLDEMLALWDELAPVLARRFDPLLGQGRPSRSDQRTLSSHGAGSGSPRSRGTKALPGNTLSGLGSASFVGPETAAGALYLGFSAGHHGNPARA